MDRLALLAIPAVRSAVTRELGREIEYHASIGSTQDRARELAREARAVLIVADTQTAGRGRGDRRWRSEPGTSLLASWVFRPAPAEPALFALVAGVAVARALASFGAADARLKWPNDVLYGGKKIAGCLAHGSSEDCVLGIGVNVGQRAFPADLAGATSLVLQGYVLDRLALLARLHRELEHIVDPGARADALAEWKRRAIGFDREIEIVPADGDPFRGRALALAEDGALVIQTPYGQRRIVAGEVRVVE